VATRASVGMVYGDRKIKENCLTGSDECEIARSLLEKMVTCVCKSFVEKVEHDDGWLSKTSSVSMIAPLKELNEEKNVLVPITREGNTCNVRKISFSQYTDTDNNPAPDPVLLLAKATSNWLKRQCLPILPSGSNDDSDDSANEYDDDDDDDDSGSSYGPDYVASWHQEAIMRGWIRNTGSEPHNARFDE
jgi:hypothetical protein